MRGRADEDKSSEPYHGSSHPSVRLCFNPIRRPTPANIKFAKTGWSPIVRWKYYASDGLDDFSFIKNSSNHEKMQY